MLNIYICEDNPQQLSQITQYVKNTIMIEDLSIKLALSSANPHSILDHVKNNEGVGLYFLDIELNSDLNGLTLAQQLRIYDPRGFIVFITTHSEMSQMTFRYKVEAMDFILKDNTIDIRKNVHDCILDACNRYQSVLNKIQKTLTLKINDRKITVDYDEILFLETSPNIHKVILHAWNQQIEFYGKLKDLEKQLDDTFYRCHRSFLVNKKNIKEVDTSNHIIHMKNGETCLVSTRMMKGV